LSTGVGGVHKLQAYRPRQRVAWGSSFFQNGTIGDPEAAASFAQWEIYDQQCNNDTSICGKSIGIILNIHRWKVWGGAAAAPRVAQPLRRLGSLVISTLVEFVQPCRILIPISNTTYMVYVLLYVGTLCSYLIHINFMWNVNRNYIEVISTMFQCQQPIGLLLLYLISYYHNETWIIQNICGIAYIWNFCLKIKLFLLKFNCEIFKRELTKCLRYYFI